MDIIDTNRHMTCDTLILKMFPMARNVFNQHYFDYTTYKKIDCVGDEKYDMLKNWKLIRRMNASYVIYKYFGEAYIFQNSLFHTIKCAEYVLDIKKDNQEEFYIDNIEEEGIVEERINNINQTFALLINEDGLEIPVIKHK